MELLAGPYFAFALLLLAAGARKAAKPGTTTLALRSVGLAVPTAAVRAGGAAEALLGFAALAVGGPVAALAIGASYAAFAGFVLVALRRGGVVSSCGCFGTPDTPPTGLHVAVNVAAALASVGFALSGARALPHVVGDQPLAGVPFLLTTAICGWLGYLLLAVLPTVHGRRAAA